VHAPSAYPGPGIAAKILRVQPLVLSNFSIVTSLGAGRAATVAALQSGAIGVAPCRFESATLSTHVGEIPGLDDADDGIACRNSRLAHRTLEQDGFMQSVAAARAKYGAHRIGVFVGTSTSGIRETELAYRTRNAVGGALPSGYDYARTHNTFSVAAFVAEDLALDGPTIALSSACATTAKAFAAASRMIAAGQCDAAVVGGADTLCLTTLYGFHALGLLSAEPCRPFDQARDGISIGEGAGFALLEKPGNETGDAILLLGAGESGDAYHMSTPHPEGLGARLAMERALKSAALAPKDIDYINLHGTATRTGDASEDLAVTGLFGSSTPCSSTKGQTGHTLGAAGIVETIIGALSILHGVIPGSPNTRAVDPQLKSRYVIEPQAARLDRVMSNSFGFGGSNCSLILGRAG
jgi:3-oxoacyl-[acyl-carrier-protein] synthase-1